MAMFCITPKGEGKPKDISALTAAMKMILV